MRKKAMEKLGDLMWKRVSNQARGRIGEMGAKLCWFFYVKRRTGRACLKKKNWPLDKGSKGRRKGMRHLALNNLPFKLSTRK